MCLVQQVKKMAELYLHGIISYNADCWISATVLNILGLGFATKQQANQSVLKMKARRVLLSSGLSDCHVECFGCCLDSYLT